MAILRIAFKGLSTMAGLIVNGFPFNGLHNPYTAFTTQSNGWS